MAPLDCVLDIPGNRHVFERLRELVASGKAIAFSGAGASAGLYPLWPELVQLLIGEAVKRGVASEADRTTWKRLTATRPQQVVRGVREKLGRHVYGAVLRELFGHRGDPAYTDVQGLLVRLPFRGHLTTNYDPGLLEARRLLRPDVPATGYATWRDHDAIRAWHTGDAFGDHACPLLYAHGVFERSDTIVLGVGEYREAYRPGPFRELMRSLWSRERFLFVGFGFSDTWFDLIAEEVLGLTREGAGEPRHIAIVHLPEHESYSPELRTMFRDAYDAEVLLYPVDGGDHGALAAVLAELAGPPPAPTSTSTAPGTPQPGETLAAAEIAGCHAQLEGWIGEARTPISPVGPSSLGSHGYQRSFEHGIIAWSEAGGAQPVAYAIGAVYARLDRSS
jgi:SIR2-like domain/LGFP repeat